MTIAVPQEEFSNLNDEMYKHVIHTFKLENDGPSNKFSNEIHHDHSASFVFLSNVVPRLLLRPNGGNVADLVIPWW